MTAPATSRGLFGRGAHAARPGEPADGDEQHQRDEPRAQAAGGDEPGALLTTLLPLPVPAPPAGPAERALLAASRELAALHPLDRLEQDEPDAGPVPVEGAVPVEEAVPVAAQVPWAVPPVLDVLPSGGGSRGRSARDLVLPAVLLTELLAGVWLGTAKPWQGEAGDPMQARFSSTAPASEDLRLPQPAAPVGAVPLPASSFVLPSVSPSTTPSRGAVRQVDPFRPR